MNLPPSLKRILAVACLFVPIALVAAEKAPHDGRLMDGATVRAEFLVKPDQSVVVYLYTSKLAPLAPSDQAISLILQVKDGAKTKIDLGKGADAFVSATPVTIPEGTKAILTVKAGGKSENFRFDLNMGFCRGCQKPEYSCTCTSH